MKSEDDEGVWCVCCASALLPLSAVIKRSQTPGVALSLSVQSEETQTGLDRTGPGRFANLRLRLRDVIAG